MKVPEAEFKAGAVSFENIPNYGQPEIAFAGRSNVGKSSLINSIVLRKNLAQISSNPGKTKQLNFYLIDNKWYLVDLPGFGFASVSKKQREDWQKVIFTYLEKRENLKLVCALCDSRHDPSEIDLGFWEWLEFHQKKFIIVLTKCDKISEEMISERIEQITTVVKNCSFFTEIISYSTISGLGRNKLWAVLKKHI